MSYMDVPRLHFAGNFIAQPSTLNNTPSNFDPANFNNLNPSWNPNGNHFWQFSGCTVQTAVNSNGPVKQDPILQAAVVSTDQPIVAKLVDLDTEQQLVSQIWGLQIKVAISDTDYFVGDFLVVCFNDINFSRAPGGGDAGASAFFQSFLDNVTWGSQITSPFLQELQNASPARLSIKFVVDGYDETSKQGRVVGTIGPAWADEPPNFVLGRALRPNAKTPNQNPLWFGYARVDKIRQKVLIDLGNSIPTTAPGGPPPNLGTLQVAIIPASGKPTILGDYDYSLAAYTGSAGIQEYSVNEAQLAALAKTPLGVIQTNKPSTLANPPVLLREGQNGTYINSTQQVYRMNPGDVDVVEMIALQFGEPASGQKISLQFNNTILKQQASPGIPVGKPATALQFPQSVTTNDDGRASFPMAATDPGNPRQFIDGQVYGVGYSWPEDADPNFPTDPWNFVSVLVFDSYEESPTWKNIQPIMQQYAALYPFMDTIFQLDDPTVIQQNIAAFQQVLNIPVSDPRYMPVTRDMSRDKRQLILEWLNLGAPVK
ncbi:MAG TPA: hypothetical protein VF791_21635 [Pyrinomonadaceae bacterium]